MTNRFGQTSSYTEAYNFGSSDYPRSEIMPKSCKELVFAGWYLHPRPLSHLTTKLAVKYTGLEAGHLRDLEKAGFLSRTDGYYLRSELRSLPTRED